MSSKWTMDGYWNNSSLVIEFVGQDLSEEMIAGVVAGNRDEDAFTHTVEAGSEREAFRVVLEEITDAARILDGRGDVHRVVFDRDELEASA